MKNLTMNGKLLSNTTKGVGVLLFLSLFLFLSSCVTSGSEEKSGIVQKVIDGDSLQVKLGGNVKEVRLWGIDCPEYGQAYGEEAKKLSKNLLTGKEVHLHVKDVDSYDRLVAIVSYEDVVVNEELIENGAAWVYTRYCQEDICTKWQGLERVARNNRVGLWKKREAIAPWKWRQLRNNR